jgi:hypothetical protein
MLVRVLDGIRSEAVGTRLAARYAIASTETDDIWQARSRAYVHLYLKVMFGIMGFEERETYVTDGTQDGGIDGYFIDTTTRTIFLLQSKFRNTEQNFENKPIEIDELLSMQIRRVLSGEDADENGVKYNGKILGLQRRVSEILDIGRYKPRVLILANLQPMSPGGQVRSLLDKRVGAVVIAALVTGALRVVNWASSSPRIAFN